jgi:hypothetical protein
MVENILFSGRKRYEIVTHTYIVESRRVVVRVDSWTEEICTQTVGLERHLRKR